MPSYKIIQITEWGRLYSSHFYRKSNWMKLRTLFNSLRVTEFVKESQDFRPGGYGSFSLYSVQLSVPWYFFSGSQGELTGLLCDFFIVNKALISHLSGRGRLKTRFYLLQMTTGRWFEFLQSEWTKPIYMTKQRFIK